MIYLLIFLGFIDVNQEIKGAIKDWHSTLRLRNDFGLVMEGKGFLPNVDMNAAEQTYLSSLQDNPYTYFALGDIYRYKKYPKKEKEFFQVAIDKSNTFGKLVILDKLFCKNRLWGFSDITRKKILKKLNTPFYTLSILYEYTGVKNINKGIKKKGLRDMEFSEKIDPGNRNIYPLLIKSNLPKIKPVLKYSLAYLSTFKYFRNQIFLIHALYRYILLFIFLFSLYYIIALFFKKIPALTRFLSSKIPIHHWWFVSIFALIVIWLYPLYGIIFTILIISPILSRKEFVAISFILILFSSIPLFSLLDSGIENGVNANAPLRNLIYLQEVIPEPQMVQNAKMNNLAYYCTMGNIYYKKDKNTAYSYYSKGLRKFSNNPLLLNNIGCIFAKNGEQDSAFYYLELAGKFEKISPIPHLNLSNLYIKDLKFKEAEKERNLAQKYNSEITGNINSDTLFLMKVSNVNFLKSLLHSSEMPEKVFLFSPLLLLIMGISCILVIALLKKFLKFPTIESCTVCGGFVEKSKTVENNKVCNYCYHKLMQTKSKGIRERFKRLIKRNVQIRIRIKSHILNIILPGSGFILIGNWKRGIFITFIISWIIISFLYPYILYGNPVFSTTPSSGKFALTFIIFIVYMYEILMVEREAKKWH